MKKQKSGIALLAILCVGASLAGCSTPPMSPEAVFVEPKTITAEWRMDAHPVAFSVGSDRPAAGELAELDQFLARYADNLSSRVFVTSDPAVTGRELSARRLAMLQRHVSGYGLTAEPSSDAALGEMAAGDPGIARIYVGHYAAVTPVCPDWRKPTASDFTNTQASNYGCSSVMNLSQMLANPGDLLRGQRMGPSDGARAALAIKDYREGKRAAEQNSSGASAGGSTTGGSQ